MSRGSVIPNIKEKPGSPTSTAILPESAVQEKPANMENPSTLNGSNINWLNGSYSGADIKVVAHLYGKVDREAQIQKIQEEIDSCNTFKKLCETFLGKIPSIETAIPARNIIITLKLDRSGEDSAMNQLEVYFKGDCGYMGGGEGPDAKAYSDFKGANFNNYIEWLVSNGKNTNAKTSLIQNCDDLYTSSDQLLKSYEDEKKRHQEIMEHSSTTLVLGSLQTISLSTHREKFAVLALGKSQASSYTRGPRTIAGSMIFTLFEEHPLKKLLRAMDNSGLYGETKYDFNMNMLLPDQLPPIDLTIIFANEYGSMSKLGIYGVEFVNDGLTMSIEDLFTEEVFNFVARDIDIMTHVGLRRLSQIEKSIHSSDGKVLSGSDLYYSDQKSYDDYLRRLDSRLSFMGR